MFGVPSLFSKKFVFKHRQTNQNTGMKLIASISVFLGRLIGWKSWTMAADTFEICIVVSFYFIVVWQM
jgi:hypothetical protein